MIEKSLGYQCEKSKSVKSSSGRPMLKKCLYFIYPFWNKNCDKKIPYNADSQIKKPKPKSKSNHTPAVLSNKMERSCNSFTDLEFVELPPSACVVTVGRSPKFGPRLVSTGISQNSSAELKKLPPLEWRWRSRDSANEVTHVQVNYMKCLVKDLDQIYNSPMYWGKIDRHKADSVLENQPDGTFLLRDSAQQGTLFSVSFRQNGRTLHVRIDQDGYCFSFDCSDPNFFCATTVMELIQYYSTNEIAQCLKHVLRTPLPRKNVFSLQDLCRAKIVANKSYDNINQLPIPVSIKTYLKHYHFERRIGTIFNENVT